MKKRIKILLMAALLIAPVAVPVSAKPVHGKGSGYSVTNPNHEQQLGGRSERASKGLSTAASHSRVVRPSKGGGPELPPAETNK